MMYRNTRRCLLGTLFAGGFLAFGDGAAHAAPLSLRYSSAPAAPASTGIDAGMLAIGLLLLAFGGLLALILRRKRG